MIKVGIIGAGGKMGCRITDNLLKKDGYELLFCENGQAGIERLAERGVSVTPIEKTAADSDIVILAVPDVKIYEVSKYVVPMLKKDAVLITLDPAAACAN